MNQSKQFFVALCLLFPACVMAGSVASLSAQSLVEGGDGKYYMEVIVDCASSSEPRAIWRDEAGGDWCGRDVSGFCSRKKMIAAQKVCGRKYSQALDTLAKSPKEVPAEAQAPVKEVEGTATAARISTKVEKASEESVVVAPEAAVREEVVADVNGQQRELEIERERLKIEQKRLELRRQNVELQKQELEIKNQLEAKAKQEAAVKTEVEAAVKPEMPSRKPVESGSTPKSSVLGM